MILIFAVTMWLATAFAAFVVAPRDRPWSFFWCTLLLLGPLGIALALVAPARPKPEQVTALANLTAQAPGERIVLDWNQPYRHVTLY